MRLTLQVVARTLFNTDVTRDVQAINDEVNVIMGLYNFLVALPKAEAMLHWPIPGLMRFRKARKRLDAIVYRMIEQCRKDGSENDRGDLLSMLISSRDEEGEQGEEGTQLSDEQLRDEVLTIFLAGYETVANALSWTWLLLGLNPDAEARMHAEIDAVLGGKSPTLDDLPRLKYTEMVFAESMRLYPPAWAMGRQATQDIEIGPYKLPEGTYLFFSQYIMQRSQEQFADPLRFDPERFSAEAKAGRPKFAYFPFGGGNRQCIGEAFAWMEGILLLATIAQWWRLRLVPGQAIGLSAKITLRPDRPIRVVPELRCEGARGLPPSHAPEVKML